MKRPDGFQGHRVVAVRADFTFFLPVLTAFHRFQGDQGKLDLRVIMQKSRVRVCITVMLFICLTNF